MIAILYDGTSASSSADEPYVHTPTSITNAVFIAMILSLNPTNTQSTLSIHTVYFISIGIKDLSF